jgi:CDP-paratose 2-epimerase
MRPALKGSLFEATAHHHQDLENALSTVIVTGSSGLIGSETTQFFHAQGFDVVGIDNNMRAYFFGQDGSVDWNASALTASLSRFRHVAIDIRDVAAVESLFQSIGKDIALVVHCAAQPSHDWAAREPMTDFTVNASPACWKSVRVFTLN